MRIVSFRGVNWYQLGCSGRNAYTVKPVLSRHPRGLFCSKYEKKIYKISFGVVSYARSRYLCRHANLSTKYREFRDDTNNACVGQGDKVSGGTRRLKKKHRLTLYFVIKVTMTLVCLSFLQ